MDPSESPLIGKQDWVLDYVSWRRKLFTGWLSSLQKYINSAQGKFPSKDNAAVANTLQ